MSAVRSAIVGMARTRTPFVKNRTSLQMHTDLAIEAAQDAGVRKAEIDGVLTAGCDDPTYCEDVAHSAVFCEYAGLKPRYTYTVDIGTPAFAKMIEIGADALAARRCNVLLIACAEPTVSKGSRKSAVEKMAAFGHPEFEVPFGVSIPAFYGLIARRFMHEFGLTQEQMATVAVTMREHASRNPASRFRDPITVADVISSPMIASPLHRLDCSVTTDGGAAFIMTTLDRARDLRQRPVVLLGAGQGFSHEHLCASPSLTEFGAHDSAAAAFAAAGVRPADIDVAFLYDNFTISVIAQLEELGFCGRGEGGAFVAAGHIRLGGELPVNPNGGLLSEGHPNRPGGIYHVAEAVEQLRRSAGPRQVADAELALVHGVGGIMSNHATIVLARH